MLPRPLCLPAAMFTLAESLFAYLDSAFWRLRQLAVVALARLVLAGRLRRILFISGSFIKAAAQYGHRTDNCTTQSTLCHFNIKEVTDAVRSCHCWPFARLS